MQTVFSPELQANLTVDDNQRVRHILHTAYYPVEASTTRAAANEYVRAVAGTFGIPAGQLAQLHQPVDFLAPRPQGIEYRLLEVKKFFTTATYAYYQTIHNTPVWGGGLTVTVKDSPHRVVHADHRGHGDLEVELPPEALIERLRKTLRDINAAPRGPVAAAGEGGRAAVAPRATFRQVFREGAATARARTDQPTWLGQVRIKRGLFYIYRYEAKDRQPGREGTVPPPVHIGEGEPGVSPEAVDLVPTLPLPPAPGRIRSGRHYLVVEIVFQVGRDPLKWKALVESQTGAILWLRPMTASVNGLVFTYDPKTSTGTLANTADSTNATLNPMRDDVTLQNLNAPVMGVQSLAGTNVVLSDDDAPTFAAPTKATGVDFDYDARTNAFAAVNAYYHADNVFEVIESLGFTLSGAGAYFDGTAFPVHLDHRASGSGDPVNGIEINAFCNGDAGGASGDGIGLVGYCLSDDTGVADTTTNPLGRSVDKWVHWHEIGGHGILYDHVNGPNFGFAHSAGDSLAAFQNDPESQLRSLPQRFQYAPFRTWPVNADRWFNRTVASGWGWGGTKDTGGYNTEQIIATTLFRVYQALGGDAADVPKRWHASRVATYLVLNAVGKLSPGANANSPTDLYNKLIAADADDWASESLFGGAYGKVLRWSFELQGLWRASGAPTTDPGQPPAVDLYINDGRGGEYQYLANHWSNQSVWNRTAADGIYGQQPGVAGVESYAYVKVKNRGTTDASGTVKLYHSLPGAGLTWPTDFVQAGPAAGLPTGTVLANNGNEVTVGPFAWTPNVNAYGHDCLLAIVETAQDPSNVANFTPAQTIQEWRLVPHDNNVGQRNVQLVPGGGESAALSASLEGAFFVAGNNLNKPAQMELRFELPRLLASRGWGLAFAGLPSRRFRLKAGEKRRIELHVSAGVDFTADDVRADVDRAIHVTLYGNGMLLGGMSYQLDPDIEQAPTRGRPEDRCRHIAEGLLDCLHVGRGRKVRHVCVKKVSLDIELDSDCGCD